MIKHFEQFVPNWLHNKAKNQCLSPNIDWHFPGNGGLDGDITKSCFMRLVYDRERYYENWNGLDSLSYTMFCWIEENKDWFEFKDLVRCIVNFYAPGQNPGWHTDHDRSDFYTLIYYVNESDGGTEVGDQKFYHKENSGIILKSNQMHIPIASTVPRRISVAWILEGREKC